MEASAEEASSSRRLSLLQEAAEAAKQATAIRPGIFPLWFKATWEVEGEHLWRQSGLHQCWQF